MNRDVLQLLCSTDLILQVHNQSMCSLKTSDSDLTKFFLDVSSYFLVLFLEELAPIIYEIPLIEMCNSLGWSSNYMQHLYTQD